MRIYISPSQVATADNCRRQHWYHSIRKVKVSAQAASLVFGKCLDIGAREYLNAHALGSPLPDPASRFVELWRKARESPIRYTATQTPQQFEQMGTDLMKALPGAWEQTGFQIALDDNSHPLLDLRLKVSMGTHAGIEVILTGVLDVVAYSAEIELGIIDVKSAVAAHTGRYALCSDQLTSYQILLAAHREALGLPQIKWLGFWDFLKRKAARIEAPLRVPLRSADEVREFREKLFWIAQSIARGHFPKASRLQHNTPCQECDYGGHCIEDDEDGLVFPGDAPRKPVQLTGPLTARS